MIARTPGASDGVADAVVARVNVSRCDTLMCLTPLLSDEMMATTHGLTGMALALPLALAAPELAPVALAAGFAGGMFPDLDLYTNHRKDLHYPVYFFVLAAPAAVVAALVGSPTTVALAVFLFAAAVHSAMDALGGGLEFRPWKPTSKRGVYNHYRKTWVAPRRWIRYDGAPEDLLLAAAVSAPLLLAFDGRVQSFVLLALAVSAAYVAVRKRLADLAERIVERTPERFRPHVRRRLIE